VVHVEVEGSRVADLPRRMFEYYGLLWLLTVKLGPLPAFISEAIERIGDPAILDRLSEQLLTANSLEELALPAFRPVRRV